MAKSLFGLAALSLMAACAPGAGASPASSGEPAERVAERGVASSSPAAVCRLTVTPTPNGVRFDAILDARERLDGVYELAVIASGPSGASETVQGGPFEAAAGERVALAVAETSAPRGSRRTATLTIQSGTRELCRATRSG